MPATLPPLPEDATPHSASVPAPPRVAALLDALRALARQMLAAPLTLAAGTLERGLPGASPVPGGLAPAGLPARAQRLGAFADAFAGQVLDGLSRALDGLFEDTAPGQPAAPLPEPGDIAATDPDAVLAASVRRQLQRSDGALQLLCQRLAVLAARPALEPAQVPLGAAVLCGIVRRLAESAGLDAADRLALYRRLDRHVLERLGDLLERANALLDHEGVLPGLVNSPYLARSAALRQPLAAPAARTPGVPASPPADVRALAGWYDAGTGPGSAASWSAILQETLGSTPAPGPMSPPAAAAAAPAMTTLHGWLAAARGEPAAAPDEGPAVAVSIVPRARVDALLGQLQARVARGASPPRMADLHAALLGQLRAELGPHATLAARDGDTLDLLGLLFEQLRAQQRPDAAGHDLVGRLQVPLARAALADPGFFVRDTHPARELLNTLAEFAARWSREDDLDPQLLQKLERSVDGIVQDYHDDPAVFVRASEDIQQHFRAAAHRAGLAERRLVEAARCRERLALARHHADTLIEQACAQAAPPRLVRMLLRQAWADVLTLCRLRHGEASTQWQQRLAQTSRIVHATACAPAGQQGMEAALAAEIEAALLDIGCPSDQARAIATRLSTPASGHDAGSGTALAVGLKARTPLGGPPLPAADAAELPAAAPGSAEAACLRTLHGLPFGTWFEFRDGTRGMPRRRRLAWYSPATGHALFVTARGQPADDYTLATLARQMHAGHACLVSGETGRLIDRAWQAALRELRTAAGAGSGARP